jgi:hypothetical protein
MSAKIQPQLCTRQARCNARSRLRDCLSSSGVAGSAMRARKFSSSSQITTECGQILTSKFSRHSPSSQNGRASPEAICPAEAGTSSDPGEAVRTVAEKSSAATTEPEKEKNEFIGGNYGKTEGSPFIRIDPPRPGDVQSRFIKLPAAPESLIFHAFRRLTSAANHIDSRPSRHRGSF